MTTQTGDGILLSGACLKVRVNKPGQSSLQEALLATRDLYRAEEELQHRRIPKVVEAEFPLISSYNSKWKVKDERVEMS